MPILNAALPSFMVTVAPNGGCGWELRHTVEATNPKHRKEGKPSEIVLCLYSNFLESTVKALREPGLGRLRCWQRVSVVAAKVVQQEGG